MKQMLKDAMIVARRDYFAVVATPTFLLFLLSPLFMIGFGLVGGAGAVQMGKATGARKELVAIVSPADRPLVEAADARLRRTASPMVPKLVFETPNGKDADQAQALLGAKGREVNAILHGPLATPHITYRTANRFQADFLATVADDAAKARKSGLPANEDVTKPVRIEIKAGQAQQSKQQGAGYGAVFVIFLLTLMLGGQSAGMMAEEKGNKVIEILVAAIHIESIFMGKLVGLFAIAMTFIAFWGALLGIGFAALPITVQSVLADATPAIGLPWFFTLGTIYFTMSFMLLGAIFLGMGALASSMREVQMMSLPITALQVGMFALANAAASAPGTEIATFAEIFPFSSPFAMAARGATDAAILPHFAAILWQALWVGLVIYGAARLFKRGVLKSGGRLFSRRKVAATNG